MNANINTTPTSIRQHIVIFGKELEFATGIRAMAAEKIMRERGIMDPDDLFIACEDLIEGANLFESYDSPANTYPSELVLGQGCPFPSIEAYIALREHYGDEWPLLAMKQYAAHHGTVKLGKDADDNARKLLDRARVCFEYNKTWHTPFTASDGYGRYERAGRIAKMNAYLAATA